jgi:hypothetical protein
VRIRQGSGIKLGEGGTVLESGKDGTLLSWPDPQKPLKLTLP